MESVSDLRRNSPILRGREILSYIEIVPRVTIVYLTFKKDEVYWESFWNLKIIESLFEIWKWSKKS